MGILRVDHPDIEAFIDRKLDCIEPEDEWLILPEVPPVRKVGSRRRRPSRRKRK